jgi:multiple sugar transport system ATP-binding protein
MNLIEGQIETADGSTLRLPDGHLVAVGATPAASTGRNVIFGIRPENVRLDPEAGLPCVVSLVEPMGSETHIIAHAGETEIVAVLKERTRIHEGDPVKLSFDTAQAHFFDPESGQRLSLS